MEISASEIKKISKKFMISEDEIINFLADEERLARISIFRRSFLEEKNRSQKDEILTKWRNECRNFCDFEDIYIVAEPRHITEDFFLEWLKACKYYKERKDVYSCLEGQSPDFIKKFIETWIDLAKELEDIREAISHVERDSAGHKKGLKKITAIYKC